MDGSRVELALYLFLCLALTISHYVVYHSVLLELCNTTVFMACMLALALPIVSTLSAHIRLHHPYSLEPTHLLLYILLASQLIGTVTWLARRLLDASELFPFLTLLVLVPALARWMWRKLISSLWSPLSHIAREAETFLNNNNNNNSPIGRLWVMQHRLTLMEALSVLETSFFSSYVIGVLPPLFSRDPHLFFDWWNCTRLAISLFVACASLLCCWSLSKNMGRLYELWRVLGYWDPVIKDESPEGSVVSWEPSEPYVCGAVVRYEGSVWIARGPLSNMSYPGSVSAKLTHWLMNDPLLSFNILILCHLGLVSYHVVAALGSRHWVADAMMAFLNYPVTFTMLNLRWGVAGWLNGLADRHKGVK